LVLEGATATVTTAAVVPPCPSEIVTVKVSVRSAAVAASAAAAWRALALGV
jgi:hypothetical protein